MLYNWGWQANCLEKKEAKEIWVYYYYYYLFWLEVFIAPNASSFCLSCLLSVTSSVCAITTAACGSVMWINAGSVDRCLWVDGDRWCLWVLMVVVLMMECWSDHERKKKKEEEEKERGNDREIRKKKEEKRRGRIRKEKR